MVLQDGEEEHPVDGGVGMFSGPDPDLGLDGSTYSRPEQIPKAISDIVKHITRFEGQGFVGSDPKAVLDEETLISKETQPSEGDPPADDYQSNIKRSIHEYSIYEGIGLEQTSRKGAEEMPAQEIPHLLAEHSRGPGSEQALDESISGESVPISESSPPQNIDEAQRKKRDLVTLDKLPDVEEPWFEEGDMEGKKYTQQNPDSKDEVQIRPVGEGPDEEDHVEEARQGNIGAEEDQPSEIKEHVISGDEGVRLGAEEHIPSEVEEEEIQEKGRGRADVPGESLKAKSSTITIIDPESDQEDENLVQPGSPQALAPEPVITAKPDTGSTHSSPPGFVAEVSTSKESPIEEQEAHNNRSEGHEIAEDRNEIAITTGKFGNEPAQDEGISGPQAKVDEQSQSTISKDLASTVRDTYDEPSTESQLITPNDTQQSGFISQASSDSSQIALGAETLPTPRLTQGTSAGIIPPEQFSLPASQEPSQSIQPSATTKEIAVAPEKTTLTPQKAPNLIEKLRAMRKLSMQTSRRSSDVGATSPWFAPKRSSQIVPDSEAGSEVEVSEDDRSSMHDVASTGSAPQKEQSAASAFKRSSARATAESMNSSPSYLPSSQPPPPGFRTNLSYFVPLATLLAHFTTTVDILAIAVSSTRVTQSTSGPRDYNQTIYLTDPSASTLQPPVRRAQIFRSYNKCFPIVEKGDAVMLRDFRVQSFQKQMTLLSTQSSSWAVFRKGAGVQVRGPPIEFGAEERLFARGMWRWWDGLNEEERVAMDEAIPMEEPKKAKVKNNETNGTAKTTRKA